MLNDVVPTETLRLLALIYVIVEIIHDNDSHP